MSAGELTFVAHARTGLAQLAAAPAASASATRAALRLKVAADGGTGDEVQVSPYGPGDVTGLEARQILGTEPRPDTDNFAPNLFPFVEFDRPDLPWLFTPAAPANGRLRPWLVLVVVREEAPGNRLDVDPLAHPLPKLTVASAQADLPDLDEAWAWAHAQVTGPLGSGLGAVDAANPERTVSRLVCPRRLVPFTRYLACLVPAYRAGAQAGLGREVTPGLDRAWSQAGTAPVELPVYHHWRFGTGPDGDFESLARRLAPRAAPDVGERAMDVSKPGSGLPSAGTGLGLQGALKAPSRRRARKPAPRFRAALEKLLDTGLAAAGAAKHVLAPPLYGRWPVAAPSVAKAPAWLRELNLDPRHRAAAGIGGEIVREREEELMAAAWAQAGEVLRANELLRQAQAARAATASALSRRLDALDAPAFVAAAAPVLGRLRGAGAIETLLAEVRASALPAAVLEGGFRRALRPRGPLARRAGGQAGAKPGGLLARLNAWPSPLVPARELPDGAQTHADLPGLDGGIRQGPAADFALTDEQGERNGDAHLFEQAAIDLLDHLVTVSGRADPVRSPLDLRTLRNRARAELDAEKTVPARVIARLRHVSEDWEPADPLEPVMAAPSFPTPMFGPLRARSQELVAPGVGELPPDTVTLLETNNRFVNSYMVGLNHEMARELLWRGYPTDQRGTFFRQFWDPATRVPPPGGGALGDPRDLPELHTWPAGRALASAGGAGAAGRTVLLIRGELLRRYPNTTIYAVRAATGPAPALGSEERHPVFGGALDPDVTFLGFDMPAAEAVGSPGWFFVLQEQPTQPAFGLEFERPGVFASSSTSLADLSWGEMAADAAALAALTHAPATAPSAWPAAGSGSPAWGTNSADMASLTLQEPARVAIHAKHMVPAP